MSAELSAESVLTKRPAFDLGAGSRLAMIALGYLPLLHIVLTIGATAAAAAIFGRGAAVLIGIAMVYLLPPLGALLARPTALLATLDDERCSMQSSAFLRWWYITQWQVVFNRLPALEELLRLVPGLYSTWLRLWGSKIGAFVYWSPGVKLYDRSFLRIGARVVIGADTKICPHMIARAADAGGAADLALSPIVIGDDVLVGGSSLLPAGVSIAACEQTPGGRPMAPFARYSNGRHQRTTRFGSDACPE